MNANTQTLPPIAKGLPLLGTTLDFLKDPFGFVQNGLNQYGPVFMTSFLGQSLVVLVGPDAATLWLDEEKVERKNAMPSHFKSIFGSDVISPLLDGEKHKFHKQCVLSAFTPDAMISYLPDLQETTETRLQKWREHEQIRGVTELQELAMEAMLRNMLGMSADDPELKMLTDRYMSTTGAMTALPLPLPGTLYTRSKNTFRSIVKYMEEFGHKRKQNLGQDAFSRILKTEINGKTLPVEYAACEIHHCVLGGYIIWAELAMILKVLLEQPDIRRKLEQEIENLAPEGAITAKQLAQMTELLNFVQEMKRLCPNVPGQFARARQTFEFKGYTVPQGARLFLGMYATNQLPELYTDPDRFDPDRFTAERAEHQKHEHGFIPQGVGPEVTHRCPGLDYATVIMQIFTIVLLRDYDWEIPPQNMDYNWGLLPPEPIDGLKLVFKKKGG